MEGSKINVTNCLIINLTQKRTCLEIPVPVFYSLGWFPLPEGKPAPAAILIFVRKTKKNLCACAWKNAGSTTLYSIINHAEERRNAEIFLYLCVFAFHYAMYGAQRPPAPEEFDSCCTSVHTVLLPCPNSRIDFWI